MVHARAGSSRGKTGHEGGSEAMAGVVSALQLSTDRAALPHAACNTGACKSPDAGKKWCVGPGSIGASALGRDCSAAAAAAAMSAVGSGAFADVDVGPLRGSPLVPWGCTGAPLAVTNSSRPEPVGVTTPRRAKAEGLPVLRKKSSQASKKPVEGRQGRETVMAGGGHVHQGRQRMWHVAG